MQKEVKIIGLNLNQNLGILNACEIKFDENNNMIIVKGRVGDGKSTLQKGLQLGVAGSKTLKDNNLYGDIDLESQLLDGDKKIYVGCKSKNGKLEYILYERDENGKKVLNPVIDGIKATPASYLELLQTELTWEMDKLTSENPTVQKSILLKLYQSELKKVGVVFDKKASLYEGSILHEIEVAEKERDEKDRERKQCGGIADDLMAKGFNPDVPANIPDWIDLSVIEGNIKKKEDEILVGETKSTTKKETALNAIATKAAELKSKCLQYNSDLEKSHNEKIEKINKSNENEQKKNDIIRDANVGLSGLRELGYVGKEVSDWIESLEKGEIKILPEIGALICFDEDGRILSDNYDLLDKKGRELLDQKIELGAEYVNVNNADYTFDSEKLKNEIAVLLEKKAKATESNKIVTAVDSFHAWRKSNEKVMELKSKYVKLLSKVDTGVEGLAIIPEDENIFMMYDGSYDKKYFGNKKGEMRKLSAYSGTQKPMICLLIQNYLLSKKPKALRYMFIDNVPIDKGTRVLLENMAEKLNLKIILNITGDFERKELVNGEILIEGGELFFEGK